MRLIHILLIILLIFGCTNKEKKEDSTAALLSSEPSPSQVTFFGDMAWKDVSCLVSKENKFLGYLNNKFGYDAGKMTLILSFDQEQDFSVKKYVEYSGLNDKDKNLGENVTLKTQKITAERVKEFFKEEEINFSVSNFLDTGSYYYLLYLTIPDHGYHASFVVSMSSSAKSGFVKAKHDDPDKLSFRAALNVPATRSNHDIGIVCTKNTEIHVVDINRSPLDGASVIYKSKTETKTETLEKDVYVFRGDTLPDKFSVKKNINGTDVTKLLLNPEQGKKYTVILATEEQMTERYKEDLTKWGKIIWGENFKLTDYFDISKSTDGTNEFQSNPIVDTIKNRYGIIYFSAESLYGGEVDTPYHEGTHALWEKMSISDAGGKRDSIWKPLPKTNDNTGVIPDNFAFDEAQAHLGGYYAEKYFKDNPSTEYNINNAVNAVKTSGESGNKIEGVVATLLVKGYEGKEYTDVLKDMVEVKESYFTKYHKYPQHIGQFISEKLQLSSENERIKWVKLSEELKIESKVDDGVKI